MASKIETKHLGGLTLFGESRANALHPRRNEDAIYFNAGQGLAMVLDGVGSTKDGGKASGYAKEFLIRELNLHPEGFTEIDLTKTTLRKALISASQHISHWTENAGTTAVTAKFIESNNQIHAVIGSVGDSRAYHLRERHLQLVTEDDSLVFDSYPATRAREITAILDQINSKIYLENLDSDMQNFFRQRNVMMQWLGQNSLINPHLYDLALEPGDRLILASDGLSNLTRSEIESWSITVRGDVLAKSLVNYAFSTSTKGRFRSNPDDISVVVADII